MQISGLLKKISFPFSSAMPLGLDVGNFSVKLVQVKRSGLNKERILSFAVVPLSPEGSKGAVISAIQQACQQLSAGSNKVNISICGPNVIVRYIILPYMQEKDLAKSFDFELERYIPFKRQDAVVDYRILARLSNNQMVVLLVAAEERFIQERIELVKGAGLEPQIVNVDAFALMSAFRAATADSKRVTGILDVGYHLSKLVVFESDIPYFSRDIEIGEREILQVVSERLGIDFNLAKELSYQDKEDKHKQIAEAVATTLGSLLSELSLSFEYCERDLEKRVEQLYISGGGSRIKVLLEALAGLPDLKSNIWNPVQGFRLAPEVAPGSLEEYSHLLAVAVGLALS